MTTATADKTTAAPSILVQPREKKKQGMLTSGIITLVGLEKSGKSELMASSGAYVIELDAGDADHIGGRIHDIAERRDAEGNVVESRLDVFRQVFRTVLADPSITKIGIDTFGTFVKWQAQEIAEKAGLKSITDRKEGVNGYALWDELNNRVEAFINTMRASGKLFILSAHCKAPELDDEKRVVIPAGIDSYNKPGNMLARRSDLIGYAYKKEVAGKTEYRLTFQGGPLGAWGSRVESLNDKTVTLKKDNPWGSLLAAAEGGETASAEKPAEEKQQKRRK
jgi:hypothetical protein